MHAVHLYILHVSLLFIPVVWCEADIDTGHQFLVSFLPSKCLFLLCAKKFVYISFSYLKCSLLFLQLLFYFVFYFICLYTHKRMHTHTALVHARTHTHMHARLITRLSCDTALDMFDANCCIKHRNLL